MPLPVSGAVVNASVDRRVVPIDKAGRGAKTGGPANNNQAVK